MNIFHAVLRGAGAKAFYHRRVERSETLLIVFNQTSEKQGFS